MAMLKWTSGMTREDGMRNEYVRGSVTSIVKKMRLRWFGHVMSREKLKTFMEMDAEGGKWKKKTEKKSGWMQLRVIYENLPLVCT